MTYVDRVASFQQRAEATLDRWLPPLEHVPRKLHAAMRYSALSSGKRMRPLLVYFTGEVLGLDPTLLDGPACAIELIHAYSLVHDDLPAMDDDALRRGKPTCHRAFDEATAILVGDALQVLAFKILASDPAMISNADSRLRMIEALADAAGPAGMAGGQAIDIEAAGSTMELAELEHMHQLKTGALIRASVLFAALSRPDLDPDRLASLQRFAEFAGLAFQVQDDILDVEGATAELGKQRGADEARSKPTYPSVAGLAQAKERARELHDGAIAELADFGASADPLRWLSAYIIERRS